MYARGILGVDLSWGVGVANVHAPPYPRQSGPQSGRDCPEQDGDLNSDGTVRDDAEDKGVAIMNPERRRWLVVERKSEKQW